MKKILFLSIGLLFNACRSQYLPDGQAVPIITLERTPCYGPCPAYTLKIYENGCILLNGEKNIKQIGNYQRRISKKEIETLKNHFRTANFFDFKNSYTANQTDLPTTYLTFSDGNKTKTVMDYANAPQSLRELEEAVSKLLDHSKWIKAADESPKK